MKVKVCGMKYNTAEIAGLQPDYMGFIFWPGSPRYIEGTPGGLPASIPKVGVFVNAPVEEILQKTRDFQLQLIQLHGEESPAYCQALRDKLQHAGRKLSAVKIIKVFSIEEAFDFNELTPFEDCCDYFLFDTRGKLPGGNGYAFDWQLLEGYASGKAYFLSGGIGPDDLHQLKAFMERPEARLCHAVDVNSRFEESPGKKDPGLLAAFIKEVTQLEHQ